MNSITRVRSTNRSEGSIDQLIAKLDQENLEPLVQSYHEESLPVSDGDEVFVASNDGATCDNFNRVYRCAGLRISVWLKTDYGKESREEVCNQDCWGLLFSAKKGLLRIAVADGLGSSIGAETASRDACEEALYSPQISPQMLHKISHRLRSKLPSIAKRIVNNFPQQSEKSHRNFLIKSMATTIQILEFDFTRGVITFLKLGDGEAWIKGDYYPDTEGYRTLHISPFLSELPKFNQDPQAIFQHLPIDCGFYMLATDGVPKICPDWTIRSQDNPSFFHWSLSRIAKNAECDNKDNLTLGMIKIESFSLPSPREYKSRSGNFFSKLLSLMTRKKGQSDEPCEKVSHLQSSYCSSHSR